MKKITIENYRGIEIVFDVDSEKFQSVITEDATKESLSFKAVKKFIDDYKKENQDFKPFEIEPILDGYKKKTYTITGVRKDGRFVGINSDGNQEQISSYDETDYMLKLDSNQPIIEEYKKVRYEKVKIEQSYSDRLFEIKSKLNVVLLKDHKANI